MPYDIRYTPVLIKHKAEPQLEGAYILENYYLGNLL